MRRFRFSSFIFYLHLLQGLLQGMPKLLSKDGSVRQKRTNLETKDQAAAESGNFIAQRRVGSQIIFGLRMLV